jgi:DUF1009 family protein
VSIGQLSRLIEILKEEQLTELIMAGQVKHASIFSSIRPDWRGASGERGSPRIPDSIANRI